MSPGELYLVRFPFGGTAGVKIRPALLLTGPVGSVPELLFAYVTSVVPADLLPTDVIIDPNDPEFATAKLKVKSAIRLHKLATLHRRDAVRLLGKLSPNQMADALMRIRVLLST